MTKKQQVDENAPEIVALRRDLTKIQNHPTILKDVNFLNHIGYFCHDDNRAAAITKPMAFSERISLDGAPFQLEYTVTPDPRFGYPGSIAYKIWDWIDLTFTFYGRPAKNPIFFDMATLRQVCGLAKKGGSGDKLIRRAINQLRHTDISTKCYRLGQGQWVKLTYRLIDTVLEFGEKNESRCGFISVSENILTSYNNALSMTLNKGSYMQCLENTKARALYTLCYRAFYAAKQAGQENPVLIKDYRSLCAQLNSTPRSYRSQIHQQLARHLDLLCTKKVGLISSWEVTPNNTGDGFNIKITAAAGFDKVTIDKYQRSIPFLPPSPQNITNLAEIRAAEAVVYFMEKRFGLTQDEGFVGSKDISNMQKFIGLLPEGSDPKEFIDYCLNAAKEQQIELASVGGLKIFVNSFLSQKIAASKRSRQAEDRKKEQAREEEVEILQSDFLFHVWNLFERRNPDQAEEMVTGFHTELMRDGVLKYAYETGGILYRKMLDCSKLQHARSIADKAMWIEFLEQRGATAYLEHFPGNDGK